MSSLPSDLREDYAEIGDQRLHYVEAGQGPLVVLLHGFPEFWYGWRQQIRPLAAAGFHVVAPDTRGYNLSSKPDGVKAYDAAKLADDVCGLIHERGAESPMLAGHDWGGTIAWTAARGAGLTCADGRVRRAPGVLEWCVRKVLSKQGAKGAKRAGQEHQADRGE
jgi:pimeloyl-ACP methyl ester carboxylesterase